MTSNVADTPNGLSSLISEAAKLADPHGSADEPQAVNSEKNRPLYAARVKIHPKLVHGRYRLIKWVVMAITLAIYYISPWLRWDRGSTSLIAVSISSGSKSGRRRFTI